METEIKDAGGCVRQPVIAAQHLILACRAAISQPCDVTVWEDQVALFELAKTTYGSIDVVVSLSAEAKSVRTLTDGNARFRTLE